MARKLPFWEENPCKRINLGKGGGGAERRGWLSDRPVIGCCASDLLISPMDLNWPAFMPGDIDRYIVSHSTDTQDEPLPLLLRADAGRILRLARCRNGTYEYTKVTSSHPPVVCTTLGSTAVRNWGDKREIGPATALPYTFNFGTMADAKKEKHPNAAGNFKEPVPHALDYTAPPEVVFVGDDGIKLFPQPVVGDRLDPLSWSFAQKHVILAILMALYVCPFYPARWSGT